MLKYILPFFCLSLFAAETRIKVVALDTGLPYNFTKQFECKDFKSFDLTGFGLTDVNGHGTNIAGIITKDMNPLTHCFIMIKWFHNYNVKKRLNEKEIFSKYFTMIRIIKPQIVNLSLSGNSYYLDELNTYIALLRLGTKVVAAAGNDNKNLAHDCDVYPACYSIAKHKNFYVIGSGIDRDAEIVLNPLTNYGGPVEAYEDGRNVCGLGICMSGTSQATAVFTSKLVSGKIR